MKTFLIDAIDTFIIKTPDGFRVDEDMRAILDAFPEKKILVTGADDTEWTQFHLNDAPYQIFTLKHNPEKSDPQFYRILLDHFGFGIDNVVYVEHGQKAVESARSIGIETYHFDHEKRDLDALKKFLESYAT